MYKFIDTIETNTQSSRLPSEALFINGRAIEDEIQGYRTLTVSGRELIGQELDTVRKNSGDGSIYLNKTYPPRTITVQYELKATDNEDYRFKFERLNQLLNQEQMEIRFNDDYEYHYKGSLSDVGELPTGSNTVIGSFSLFCSDPFKYKNKQVLKGQSVELIFDDTYKTKPSRITAIPNTNTPSVTIKSGTHEIKLVQGSYTAGERLVFDFEGNKIYSEKNYDEEMAMKKLTLDSDFPDFYMRSGQPIEFVGSGTLEVEFKQVML